MKCLIVDDDPLIRDLLAQYLSEIEFIENWEIATNGMEALQLLENQAFDLLLLDLNLPKLSGRELLDSLDRPVSVVLITADEQFALQSYNYDVVDYLVKPLRFSRLFQALKKAKERMAVTPTVDKEVFFIKDGHELVKIHLSEVFYIESESNYVVFNRGKKKNMALLSMKKLEAQLPENFVRIHRSYIVNLLKIEKIDHHAVWVNGKNLPISTTYKNQLLGRLKFLE
ncbi:LytTR family DNA-binding domain-containing protein [Rapidithrix thailandica]|uniref:LytTR family DNA-binding domain-containing protein n=1 Tax=Rapidithrix thailandica TaxID=413964 RepID=A0AAW9RZL8_9BACT